MEPPHINYSSDLKAHAVLLRNFFSALFGHRDVVHIYPRLRPGSLLTSRSGLNPDELPTEGRVVTRRPSSTNTKTLARLHELNAQGYDIYFCINPLIHPRRCQRGVVLARNILVEMDESGMDVQLALLERFRGNVVSATRSGGKSLHMIVRLDPPIWNPNRAGHLAVPKLGKGQTSARWPLYVDLACRWIARIEMLGHSIDNRAAKDYARLSRAPGFLHAGTGAAATLEHLDPGASWDWRAEIEADAEPPEPDDEEVDAYFEAREAEVPEHVKDMIWGRDVLFPDLSDLPPPPKTGMRFDSRSPRGAEQSILAADRPFPVADASPKCNRSLFDTSRTYDVRNATKRSFLDDLDDFESLLRTGLPGRGTRMGLHKVAFTAARVFGLKEKRLAAKWRRIIEANPAGTDKEPDEAVASLLGDWRANKGFRLYLPDLKRLPELQATHLGVLAKRLIQLGCPEPHRAKRIVELVLMPLARTAPRQCVKGRVGIRACLIRDAANTRGGHRGYRPVWQWMQTARLVVCTDRSFVPERKTRLYAINIPLLLWLCGFRTGELDWSKAKKHPWPELAKLVVVNDTGVGTA